MAVITKIETVTVAPSLGAQRFELYAQSIGRTSGKPQWNFKGGYYSMEAALKAEKKLKKTSSK